MRAILLLAAFVGLGFAVWLYIVGERSTFWPVVAGQLDTSYVSTFGAGSSTLGRNDTYAPILNYRFMVGTKQYQGTRISVWDMSYGWRSLAQKQLDGYRSGELIQVHYDPQDPNNAVLRIGPPVGVIAIALFAAIGCCVMSAVLPYILKAIKSTI